MTLNYNDHFCPCNDVIFGVMFGKRNLFCRLIQAVTGDKIELDGDPHTQATMREDDVLLNEIKFDTFAAALNDKFYSVDMQRTYTKTRQERRTVYYACRAVSTQNVDDMAYEDLTPVHISFILTSHRDDRPIRHIQLCDTKTHEIFDDLITLTQVYIPTVIKTYDKNSELYIFARFFKIKDQKKADAFVKAFGTHDLGRELILVYNNAVAHAQDLQKIEKRPYFTGRLTEAELDEARQKARKKGEEIGMQKGIQEGFQKGEQIGIQKGEQIGIQKGEQMGEYKKAVAAAKKMLTRGVAPEIIADDLDLDINVIRGL